MHISPAHTATATKCNAVFAQKLEHYVQLTQEREMTITEYRCMRHDMKQHCTVVLSLLKKQQYENAERYLRNLIKDEGAALDKNTHISYM